MKTLISTMALLLLTSSVSFAGGWTYAEAIDEMNDDTIRTASVLTTDGRARLWVRCKDDHRNVINYHNFEVYVMTIKVTDSSNENVVFRIDGNKPISVATTASTNRKGEFINNSFKEGQEAMLDIVNQLKTGSNVKVKVGMFVGNPKIYKFSLSGSTKTINKVMKDCPAFY